VGLNGWLARCPLIPILRGVKPGEVEAIAAALEAVGIPIVEVPLNSPASLESIARLAHTFGGYAERHDGEAAARGLTLIAEHAAWD
jgi:2-dehydro-3-deoxyphosphogalactonate aldolase